MSYPSLTPFWRNEWPDSDFYDVDVEPVAVRSYLVKVNDDEYVFDDFDEAVRALRFATEAEAAGRTVWPCSWLVERYHPEPDSPADLVGPCGAPSVEDDDGRGWHCLAGHAHRSDAEYYEPDEAASYLSRGIPLAENAVLMDGTPVEALVR